MFKTRFSPEEISKIAARKSNLSETKTYRSTVVACDKITRYMARKKVTHVTYKLFAYDKPRDAIRGVLYVRTHVSSGEIEHELEKRGFVVTYNFEGPLSGSYTVSVPK